MKKKQFENYGSIIIKIMEQRLQELDDIIGTVGALTGRVKALGDGIETASKIISQQQAQIESERIAKLVAEQMAIKERDRADKMSEILKQIPQMQQQISSLQQQIIELKNAKHTHGYKMSEEEFRCNYRTAYND